MQTKKFIPVLEVQLLHYKIVLHFSNIILSGLIDLKVNSFYRRNECQAEKKKSLTGGERSQKERWEGQKTSGFFFLQLPTNYVIKRRGWNNNLPHLYFCTPICSFGSLKKKGFIYISTTPKTKSQQYKIFGLEGLLLGTS